MRKNILLEVEVLTYKSKEKGSTSKILDAYENLTYSDGEQFKFTDKLIKLADKIYENIGELNITFDKKHDLPYIKSGLENMYDILANNRSYTSAPRDYEERREFFDKISKGFSYLTDNLEQKYLSKEMDDMQVYFALESFGDAGYYCAGRWRELVEKLTMQLDKMGQENLGVSINPNNYIEETLKEVYANARNIEIEKLAKKYRDKFYKSQGISMETHYKRFFKRYLSEKYNLSSTTIQEDDSLFRDKNKQDMKIQIDIFIKSYDIDGLINDRAKAILGDEDLNKNSQLRDEIYQWGIQKYKKLTLSEKEKYDDGVDYVNTKVFDFDENYVIKGLKDGVVDSLVKDKGFIYTKMINYPEEKFIKKLISKINSGKELEVLQILEKVELSKKGLNKILMVASILGDLRLFDKVLEKGAEINAKDSKGKTALMYAAINNKYEFAKKLIENGAKVDSRCNVGYSAVFYASYQGSTKVLKLLLDNKQRLITLDQSFLEKSVTRSIDMLKNFRFPDSKLSMYSEGFHAFNAAYNNLHVDAVKELLKNNNNKVYIRKEEIKQALKESIRFQRTGMIEAICDSGFNIEKKIDGDFNTPLELAVKKGKIKSIKTLINKGAIINNNERSPLLLIASLDTIPGNIISAMAKVLVYGGAHINCRNEKGYTPLMLALSKNNLDLAVDLIDMGADVKARSNSGKSVLKLAESTCNHEVISMIKKKLEIGRELNF